MKKLSEEKKDLKEEKLINQAKSISIKEASAYSFMDGFGLRYITPFALAIGANNKQIGYLSSIPSLLASFVQLFTLKAMNKYSRKKIVFFGVLLQAIMWLFIIGIGVLYFILKVQTELPPTLLVIIYTMLIVFGAFGGPAWSSWMRDLVKEKRGAYFSRRSKISGTIALICMLAAGFILDYFKQTKIFLGFAILFFIAFLGRAYSALLFLKQYEPEFKENPKDYFTLLQFIRKMYQNNFGKFVIYFSLVSFATAIASPFFAVYMLKELNFSYVNYMIIILASSISSLVFLPFWGRLSDKYGNLKTMRLTGIFIPLIPFLWFASAFISSNTAIIIYLVIIEIFSGIIWTGFNLAAGNFIYDAVSRQKIAICVAYFNIISSIGIVIGASLGGYVSSLNFTFFNLSPVVFIFFLSSTIRFLVYIVMDRKIKEVRQVKKLGIRKFARKEIKKELEPLRKIAEIFNPYNIIPFKPRPI
jgi:MFS family permease